MEEIKCGTNKSLMWTVAADCVEGGGVHDAEDDQSTILERGLLQLARIRDCLGSIAKVHFLAAETVSPAIIPKLQLFPNYCVEGGGDWWSCHPVWLSGE